MYEKGVKKRLNEYRAKTTRQKYAKKVPYQEFRQHIHVSYLTIVHLLVISLAVFLGSTISQVGYPSHH
jgi:hypothetical protein